MMKQIIIFFLLLSNTVYAQTGLIFRDDAETDPPIPCAWCGTSKNVGWNVWTGGTQDYNNQDPENTWQHVTAGGGNPSPRKGTGMYKVYMERRDDLFGDDGDLNGALQHCRSELGWGIGCGQNTGARWFIVSIFLPSTWCDDAVPVQIAYDMKFGDSQGPASMSLWAENGRYVIQQLNTQYGNASVNVQYSIPGDIGLTVKNGWVDFVVERNFKDDGTGFLRVYMKRVGTDSELQLVYSHTGPNYNMQCGPNSEAYLQHGLYKWPWQNTTNQGEGNSIACGYDPITIYYDNFIFLSASATLADVNAELSGEEGPPGNLFPSVNAGPNQNITLPDDDAALDGTVSDADGTISDITWTQISGPNTATMSDPDAADQTVSNLIEGSYVFRLSATDNDGATSIDDVNIIVDDGTPPGGDDPPYPTNSGNVETATPDFTVHLPSTDTTLILYADDPDDGDPNPYGWVTMLVYKVSGPTGGDVTNVENLGDNPAYLEVLLENLEEGTYTYRMEITSNTAQVVNDTFLVNVIAADNISPTVNAGSDLTLTLDGFGPFQVKSTSLNGVVSDADGTITSVQWIIIQGPENSTFSDATSDTTILSGLIGGTYIARLIATDNDGASNFDNISIRILTCEAGIDQVISLPANTATLTGGSNSVSDTTDVLWEKVSGPSGGNIISSGTLSTGITALQAGEYEYQLTVTHTGGYVVRDRMKITVTEASTQIIRRIIKGN